MRCVVELAICALVVSTAASSSFGQASSQSVAATTPVQSLRGFAIPGKDLLQGRRPTSVNKIEIDGTTVEITFYGGLPIWDKRTHRYFSTPLTFVFVSDKGVMLDTREYVTEKLWRYSINGKPFLYSMWVYPCSTNDGKEGGCIGSDVKLAFYDDEGEGIFKRMEFVPTALLTEAARNWKPRIPEWARHR
jgi:hypothetical protein